MKEWAEDSTAGCEASGLFDEDEGSSHGQRMMSGEQGLELSGEAQWRLRYLSFRRRISSAAPSPARPVASNARLTGSGVGTGELAEA
jgi:hypothetical protein